MKGDSVDGGSEMGGAELEGDAGQDAIDRVRARQG